MRQATKIILIVTALFLIGYDIYAYIEGGVGSTISRVVLAWSQAWPIVPLTIGVICGHLFWPQKIIVYKERSDDADTGRPQVNS